MTHPRLVILLGGVMLALTGACSPAPHDAMLGIGDAGAGSGTQPRGYAVVSSDYAVSSVGLLKADGRVLQRSFIDSGSASAGLVTALSGDVVLPTRSGEQGVLVLLDRFRADVVTRIDLGSGEVLGQLATHGTDDASSDGYSSNPHDYLYLDENTAWVSRYEPKLGAKRSDPDLGLDLLRIDPTSFERSEERIDFSPWNAQVQLMNPNTGEQESVTVYARPSSIVRLGGYAVVGIDTLSASFSASGEGMAALVDLETRKVQMLKLPGLRGCGELSPVPNDAAHVAVGCTGFYRSVARESAGIAMLVLEAGLLRIEQVWRAEADPKSALTMYGVLALDAGEVLAMAAGEMASKTAPETHDKLYRVNLATGEQTEVMEAQGRFVLGGADFDADSGLLLVPDASIDEQGRPIAGVHRFERQADGSFDALGITKLDEVLPPRQVRAF